MVIRIDAPPRPIPPKLRESEVNEELEGNTELSDDVRDRVRERLKRD